MFVSTETFTFSMEFDMNVLFVPVLNIPITPAPRILEDVEIDVFVIMLVVNVLLCIDTTL